MTTIPPKPRQPGVRYRLVDRVRLETTVIDGRASTRPVSYKEWEAVPPRDWDEVIRRGVIGAAVVVTALAAIGNTAAVGGLLAQNLFHPGIAYVVGGIFTWAWLACLGVEYIERVDPERARRARHAGWGMVLLGMGAVITYGADLHQVPAGIVASLLDPAAKGLWWLVMGLDRVALAPGVAHWVAEEEQEMAGRFLLGIRLGRLRRRGAAMVGVPEFEAAGALLKHAQTRALTGTDTSGRTETPVSGQITAQPPAPGPVPDPSGPGGQPRPAAPAASGPAPDSAAASAPPTAPAAPLATTATPVPSGSHQQQDGEPGATPTPTTPGLQAVGPLSIAAAVRQAHTENPAQSDADMVARVLELRGGDDGGNHVKFTDTVTRTRRRQEKKAKGKAS
ncbi:hypothetical protein [Streptomyces sp. AD55]|uniref:hypothetical protein n=1 Tax=Streptomyces sp. AD55 TaxID=3242895 RepID=UPI003529B07D